QRFDCSRVRFVPVCQNVGSRGYISVYQPTNDLGRSVWNTFDKKLIWIILIHPSYYPYSISVLVVGDVTGSSYLTPFDDDSFVHLDGAALSSYLNRVFLPVHGVRCS